MKKIIAMLLVLLFAMSMGGCGGKKCSECGERVEKGYTAFGNFMCKDCFLGF